MSEDSIVFVVDIDHSSRIGLTSLLRTAGYHVRGFASVNKMLDVLNPDVSGCVILDARIPGLSGEEFLEELKVRRVNLPIIVVSCDDDAKTMLNAEKMRAMTFFRKPVDGTALVDTVKWALRASIMDNAI